MKMRTGLFLDDERVPKQVTWVRFPNDIQWTVVRSFDAFVKWFEDNDKQGLPMPDVISFDHDLSFDHYTDIGLPVDYEKKEKTGYHAAKWLTQYMEERGLSSLPLYTCHSMNPVGRDNILRHLAVWNRYQEIHVAGTFKE